MRRFYLLFLALLFALPARAAGPLVGTPAYEAQLAKLCPAKHLDLLSPADLDDVLAIDWRNDLQPEDRAKLDKLVGRTPDGGVAACAGMNGTSCEDFAYLHAAESMNRLYDVAVHVCSLHEECSAQSTCRTVAPQETVDRIAASFKKRGGKATLAEYFQCYKGDGYAAVASGNPSAVALAVSLRAFSDGCVSETLASALGDAMAANPAAVLPYVDQYGTRFCLPFISDEISKPAQLVPVIKAEKALDAYKDARYKPERDLCLAEVTRAKETIEKAPANP